MDLFGTLFPILIVLALLLTAWSLYEQRRFNQAEGDVKRGVMVWAEPLTWEMRQFLEELPPGLRRDGRSFIQKTGREILVAEERSMWSSFSRRNSLRYIAYVNLSDAQGRIEFRLPWSALVSVVISFLIMLLVFGFFTTLFTGPNNSRPLFPILGLLLFFAIISVGSMLFNYRQERKRLLGILNRAMGQ